MGGVGRGSPVTDETLSRAVSFAGSRRCGRSGVSDDQPPRAFSACSRTPCRARDRSVAASPSPSPSQSPRVRRWGHLLGGGGRGSRTSIVLRPGNVSRRGRIAARLGCRRDVVLRPGCRRGVGLRPWRRLRFGVLRACRPVGPVGLRGCRRAGCRFVALGRALPLDLPGRTTRGHGAGGRDPGRSAGGGLHGRRCRMAGGGRNVLLAHPGKDVGCQVEQWTAGAQRRGRRDEDERNGDRDRHEVAASDAHARGPLAVPQKMHWTGAPISRLRSLRLAQACAADPKASIAQQGPAAPPSG